MHKGQITIKDIAKELRISLSTVSKALKGHREKKHDFPSQTKIIKTELVIKGSTLRNIPRFNSHFLP